MTVNVWTPSMIATLRALHRGGGSFIEIAAQMSGIFGLEISRNACIGKARRLELPMRNEDGPRKPVSKPAKLVSRPVPVAAPIEPEPEPEVEVLPGISIYQLNGTTCRWPLGGIESRPPLRYCGCRADLGMPYCAEHTLASRGASHRLRLDKSKFSYN